LYDLYENVLAARLDRATMKREGLRRGDRTGLLKYKLADHYRAKEAEDNVLVRADGSHIVLVCRPHRNREAEEAWEKLFKEPEVTLSVDLFDVGLLFTDKRLSKQQLVFRVF
jgi:hypothetical protein